MLANGRRDLIRRLTLNLLTTTIVAPPSNASKLQMGFNSAFKRPINQRLEMFFPDLDSLATHPPDAAASSRKIPFPSVVQ